MTEEMQQENLPETESNSPAKNVQTNKNETISEELNRIVATKTFKIALIAVAQIILLAIVFSVGVKVGLKKASFSYAFGANYERNFMGPARGPMGPGVPGREIPGPQGYFMMPDGGMRNAHGLVGTIVSIANNNIIVKDNQGNENTITVNDKTLIKSRGGDLKITDLKNDERIVVVGKPDSSGVILGELIRVFENPNNNNINNNQN